MTSEKSSAHKTGSILQELPTVDWLDLARDREKFLNDLRYALSDCGFLVLTNAPGLDDDFQQRAFREVRGFFDAPMDIKKDRAHFQYALFQRLHPADTCGPGSRASDRKLPVWV